MKTKHTIATSIFLLFFAFMTLHCAGPDDGHRSIKFYVGSFDGNLEYSIFLCQLDPVNRTFAVIDSFAGAKGPSYLALSPDKKMLYTIDDAISDADQQHQSVTSFRVDQADWKLEYVNSQSSGGSGPCHVYCSKKGDYIFVANYGSGHAAAFPIDIEGAILPASSVVVGDGSGPVSNRQRGPHAHQVMMDPTNRFLLVPDLGTDKVMVYRFDPASGILTPNPDQPILQMSPGAGPRHLVFHPSGEFVYIVSELNATATACRFNDEKGTLTILKSVSTVPESHEGSKYPAAIRLHPNGKYVYASTRGENSCITTFQVDNTGAFNRIQVTENVPAWPSDFNIDPSGRYLLAAGERADEIMLYTIDAETGKLSGTLANFTVPTPRCIIFIEE